MSIREDWPFGPALERRRIAAGLSVRAAARLTQGKVSDGRWYQLESGYQKQSGQLLPISTTAPTVAAAAAAVGWNISDALRTAGFDPSAYRPKVSREPQRLSNVPTAELVDQIRALFHELRRRLPADVNEPQDWPQRFFEGVTDEPPTDRRQHNDDRDQLRG